MWQHFAVFNAILAFSTARAILDLGDICKDLRIGDVVPHPYDCQAYFICGPVPIINYCDKGLHFDAIHNVCNWPEHAHCELLTANGNDKNKEENPENNISSSVRLHPIFVAIDIDTGKQTDPMNKYDPRHIECRHYGAYFLPHPRSCRRYYICAYGHLHRHKCGRGTAWNYKRQECELNDEAECYSRIIAGMDMDAERDDDQIENDINELENIPTTPYPPTTGASTICFVIDTQLVTGTTTDSTFNPTGTYHTATSDPTWHPTGTYHTATSDPTWYLTGTYHTATTPRADNGVPPIATGGLKCPASGEAYLPNVLDCSKYFICIAGIPVATTCPKGLYWDQNAEFCDLVKNVQCFKLN